MGSMQPQDGPWSATCYTGDTVLIFQCATSLLNRKQCHRFLKSTERTQGHNVSQPLLAVRLVQYTDTHINLSVKKKNSIR